MGGQRGPLILSRRRRLASPGRLLPPLIGLHTCLKHSFQSSYPFVAVVTLFIRLSLLQPRFLLIDAIVQLEETIGWL